MTQKQLPIFKRRFRQNFQQRMGGFKLSFPWFFGSIVGPPRGYRREGRTGRLELIEDYPKKGLHYSFKTW